MTSRSVLGEGKILEPAVPAVLEKASRGCVCGDGEGTERGWDGKL